MQMDLASGIAVASCNCEMVRTFALHRSTIVVFEDMPC